MAPEWGIAGGHRGRAPGKDAQAAHCRTFSHADRARRVEQGLVVAPQHGQHVVGVALGRLGRRAAPLAAERGSPLARVGRGLDQLAEAVDVERRRLEHVRSSMYYCHSPLFQGSLWRWLSVLFRSVGGTSRRQAPFLPVLVFLFLFSLLFLCCCQALALWLLPGSKAPSFMPYSRATVVGETGGHHPSYPPVLRMSCVSCVVCRVARITHVDLWLCKRHVFIGREEGALAVVGLRSASRQCTPRARQAVDPSDDEVQQISAPGMPQCVEKVHQFLQRPVVKAAHDVGGAAVDVVVAVDIAPTRHRLNLLRNEASVGRVAGRGVTSWLRRGGCRRTVRCGRGGAARLLLFRFPFLSFFFLLLLFCPSRQAGAGAAGPLEKSGS